MKVKRISLFLLLILWPWITHSDTIYFFEGYNKLIELNCKIISIDSTFALVRFINRNAENEARIHSSRIYYIKFNDKYFSAEQNIPDPEWDELYNVKQDRSKKRIYLKNVTDSLRNKYANITFTGKDNNILIGDILQYHPADSAIKFSVTKKSGTDTLITNWGFVQYISIWYRQ